MPRSATALPAIAMLALLPIGAAAAPAAAPLASGWTLAPRDAQAAVRVGEETSLMLRGVWHDGCAPRGPHRDISVQRGSYGRSLIRLRTPSPPCAGTPTAFELALNPIAFRAEEAGVHRFIVVYESPTWAGFELLPLVELDVAVQGAAPGEAPLGAWPVGGAWQAIGAEGSGLFLDERRTPEAQRLSGLWLNFDSDGSPHWHVLADTRWHSPTRLEGAVFAVAAEDRACTLQAPNPDCDFAPQPATGIRPTARFVIDFSAPDRGTLRFSQDNGAGMPVAGQPIALAKLP